MATQTTLSEEGRAVAGSSPAEAEPTAGFLDSLKQNALGLYRGAIDVLSTPSRALSAVGDMADHAASSIDAYHDHEVKALAAAPYDATDVNPATGEPNAGSDQMGEALLSWGLKGVGGLAHLVGGVGQYTANMEKFDPTTWQNTGTTLSNIGQGAMHLAAMQAKMGTNPELPASSADALDSFVSPQVKRSVDDFLPNTTKALSDRWARDNADPYYGFQDALTIGSAVAPTALGAVSRLGELGEAGTLLDGATTAAQADEVAAALPGRAPSSALGPARKADLTDPSNTVGATVHGPPPEAPDVAAARAALSDPDATVVSSEPIGEGYNKAERVQLSNGATGIWKARANETTEVSRDNIPPGTYSRREVAASVVDRWMGGYGGVPPTVLRTINGQEGSLQEWVNGAKIAADDRQNMYAIRGNRNGDDYRRMSVLDSVLGNLDRNEANWMIDQASGRPVPIDHGFTFPTNNTPQWGGYDFMETPLDDRARQALNGLVSNRDGVTHDLSGLIEPDAINAMYERIQHMLDSGTTWTGFVKRL